MAANGRVLRLHPKDLHRRAVQLPHRARRIHQRHRQRTRVDHRPCPVRGGAGRSDGFGKLYASRDVRRDGRHVMKLVQGERWRVRRVRLPIPQQPNRADRSLRNAQRCDERRAHSLGQPLCDGARIGIRAQIRRNHRLTGPHHATGRAALQAEDQTLQRRRFAERRGDTQVLAARLFQRDEGALRFDELHQTLQRVAQQ